MTAGPERLSRDLLAAIRQIRHYGAGHPAAEEAVRRFEDGVREAAAQSPDVRWDASPEWLIVQGRLLPGDDPHGIPLRDHLSARGVARLIIASDASAAGIRTALALLAREPEELLAEGGAAEALRRAGAAGITLEAAGPGRAPPAEPDEYLSALAASHALFTAVEDGRRLDLGGAGLVTETLLAADGDAASAVWVQVAVRAHDELDPAHAVNTAFLAMQLAGGLGLGRADRLDAGVASLLHDIGMAALPWEHRLAERTASVGEPIPRHAIEGGRILRHLGGAGSVPMLAAMEHHRAVGAAPEDIAPVSRIVALADYVDAMTCGRAAGLRAAPGRLIGDLLAGRGPAFDPLHVRVLARLLARAAGSGADFAAV